MEELLKFLESLYPVDPQLQIYLWHHIPKEIHRANKTLLEEGQVCDWIAFIEKGFVKVYYEYDDVTERIIAFCREGEMVGCVKSYFTNTPSKLTIRTLEETFLRRIHKTELEMLLSKYPGFNFNTRCIIERICCMYEDHVILLGMPAKERFLKIQEMYPWMMKDSRVKDYMIASFLGIDKATFSKYRNGKE